MDIITVSGSHSGVGKTTLVSLLLRELTDYAAIKVSITDFFTSIITEDKIIRQKNKDTAIMKKSGASKVVWVKTTIDDLEDSIRQALSLINTSKGVIIESNSVLNYVEPKVAIFVCDENLSEIKPSGKKALQKANIIIVNGHPDDSDELQRKILTITKCKSKVIIHCLTLINIDKTSFLNIFGAIEGLCSKGNL